MIKFKRTICSLLAAVMLLGMTAMGVGAAPVFSDADQIVHAEAVNRAAELGYFVGSDGKFMPKETVTRAQMATVIVKMLHGADHNADPYKNMGRFPDTADYQGGWADGYINLCAQEGVVGGYGDGTFQPDKKVNAAEAVTMLLNALKVDAGEGNWPDTVMNKGTELGLFAELSGVEAGTALNRDQLAALVIAGVDWKEEKAGGDTGNECQTLGHNFVNATCTEARTCTVCGATEGEALGHDFFGAKCTVARTCVVCDATESKAPGHDFADATCTAAKTCKACGAIAGKALGHAWKDTTSTDSRTCERCGATEDKIIPDDKNLITALNNLPIANSDMTEDELRDIVAEFMKLQLTFAYTPDFADADSYQYYIKNLNGYYGFEGSQIKFKEGKYYGGIPYTGNAAGSLYRWIPFYDVETGVMDWTPIVNSRRLNWNHNGTIYPDVGSALFGNSCSASCYWAWSRVSNKLNSASTSGWIPRNGFVKVGDYTLANNDKNHGDSTKNICEENGTDVMYAAYASMKKADGLVRTGHAIMNVEDPVVVYRADGSIDGNKSYLCIAEQQAFFLNYAPTLGGVDLYSPLGERGLTYRVMGNYWGSIVNGKVKDMEWSFEELYDQGFLPFTVPELVGKDDVEEATTTYTHAKQTITLGELESSSVTSNYPISDVHFTVRDAAGDETYIGMFANETATLKTYVLRAGLTKNMIYSSTNHIKKELEMYTGGEYEIIITCRVSTGELLTVYTGTLQ